MATLKSQNLPEIKKELTEAAFQEAALRAAFLSATGDTARQALERFYTAAQLLRAHEDMFNSRARGEDAKPSLLRHLRSPAQLAAVRDFAAAKEALLEISPEAGARIVKLMAQEKGKPAAPVL